MIVPIARSLTAFNMAKARHKELNEVSGKVLIYGLLLIPALLPVLAFAHVCGLNDVFTLFLINFITFDFILVVALSMMVSADEFMPEELAVAEEVEGLAEGAEIMDAAIAEPMPLEPAIDEPEPADPVLEEPVAEEAEEVPAAEPQPTVQPKFEKLASGNPDDPIIQFLNSEAFEEKKPAEPLASAKSVSKSTPRNLPPRKPGRPSITPPKKPGSLSSEKPAPNAPSRLKAPAKPKKRF
jgi:hypothetical protein